MRCTQLFSQVYSIETGLRSIWFWTRNLKSSEPFFPKKISLEMSVQFVELSKIPTVLLGRRKVNIDKGLYARIWWEIVNLVSPAYVGKWIIYSHPFLVVVGFWFHFLTQLIPFSLRPVALLAK